MIDAKRLLEQFLSGSQGGAGPQASQPAAPSAAQAPQSGGFLGSIGGALGSAQDLARRNPMLAGALGGGLASALLGSKGGRKLAKNALKIGGVAAIGGIAYKAYSDYQAGKSAPPSAPVPAPAPVALAGPAEVPLLPPPADSPFAIANAPQGEGEFALDLVRAMIAAAKADGHIDNDERAKIIGHLSADGLDAEELAFFERELAAPLDIDRIVKAAKNPEEAIELYAASVLTITPDHPAERAYLAMLAARLEIEPELAQTIERTVSQATLPA